MRRVDGPVIKTERCEVCGGTVTYWRTEDPFTDVWRCDQCSAKGIVAWAKDSERADRGQRGAQ